MNWNQISQIFYQSSKDDSSHQVNPQELDEMKFLYETSEGEGGIKLSEKEKSLAWEEIVEQGGLYKKRVSLWTWSSGIAASVLIIFLVGIYFNGSNENRILTDTGQKTVLELSDGTRVTLNENSELTYLETFHEGNREVSLVGEAFFEVARDPGRPFTISSQGTTVKVLGTSFNVYARKDKDVEVAVLTGKVEFGLNDTRKVILVPNEIGIYHRQLSTLEKRLNKSENDRSWQSGKMVFESDKFSEVIKSVERTFDVEILLADERLRNCKVTSTIEFDDLEDVMEVLELTMDIDYVKEGETIKISGNGCI